MAAIEVCFNKVTGGASQGELSFLKTNRNLDKIYLIQVGLSMTILSSSWSTAATIRTAQVVATELGLTPTSRPLLRRDWISLLR